MKFTKEDIDKVRHIEGFPVGDDEDIIALSNPPYYTACPNPFIEEFIKQYGTPYDELLDEYHREPFASDVSEGKNEPIYNAHSYHTKVPYKAIMRYILHYTEPGDIVFDGFSGTGMTGVAAQMCQDPDPEFKFLIEQEMPNIKWGERKAVLNDLSPAASFIAHNYNASTDIDDFEKEVMSIILECEKVFGWMYETTHDTTVDNAKQYRLNEVEQKGKINYTVWSDVLICPNCGEELVFYNVALDEEKGKVNKEFHCATCKASLKKTNCERAKKVYYDEGLDSTVTIAKQVPVLIYYTVNGKRYKKYPGKEDLDLIDKIDEMEIPYWYPVDALPEGFNTQQPKQSHGIYYAHQFYTKRNLHVLSFLHEKTRQSSSAIVLQSIIASLTSRLSRYNMGNRGNGPLTGTLYVPSLVAEAEILKVFQGKVKDFIKVYSKTSKFKGNIVQCSSLTEATTVPDNSIDYIFTDPPFGDNLNYSELSFLWESWLKIKTNTKTEAIINKVQDKNLLSYQELMTKCFSEYYRTLKPGRWMTVEFHNSKNAVWNAIQESLQKAGFIVADVRTLDKKQGSFKQTTSASAVKQDLVISAYKPKDSFKREFISHAGSEETAWEFVRQHLEQLPVIVLRGNNIELVAERQAFLLFDRMVAYHIMQGIPVPLDASDFYQGLDEKFSKRDSMYFLVGQVNEYDSTRIYNNVEEIQFSLIVNDEKTAIAWLYNQLEKPQTYSELQPQFMKEVKSIAKYEKMPELSVLLEDNFLQDEESKWYIPDVTKSADVLKLREKKLLKEFEDYITTKGKLKLFRTEAVRVGFAKLWKDKNYKLIVETAERLPEKVVQEDDKLLMYYDISLSRV